jgi:hypothetical protein
VANTHASILALKEEIDILAKVIAWDYTKSSMGWL